ncbi:hypothetical protein LTR17_025589 [Elasticomyces elasticus]|nr:hypothetical protein LTR17_025589 [Elasticomyces elasticus]
MASSEKKSKVDLNSDEGFTFEEFPKAMQAHVQKQLSKESDFFKRIIDGQNKQAAEGREAVFLRLPQPNPSGHCFMVPYNWSEEDAKHYLEGGDPAALPVDLATMDPESQAICLRIFDESDGDGEEIPPLQLDIVPGEEIPPLQLDIVPNFEKHPAMVLLYMGSDDNVMLLPSEVLTMKHLSEKEVLFTIKQDRARPRAAE